MILRSLKDVSWSGAKSMMADPYFLKSLVDFDKDGLTDKQARSRGGLGEELTGRRAGTLDGQGACGTLLLPLLQVAAGRHVSSCRAACELQASTASVHAAAGTLFTS